MSIFAKVSVYLLSDPPSSKLWLQQTAIAFDHSDFADLRSLHRVQSIPPGYADCRPTFFPAVIVNSLDYKRNLLVSISLQTIRSLAHQYVMG
jgi:hypothetical protein